MLVTPSFCDSQLHALVKFSFYKDFVYASNAPCGILHNNAN